MIRDPYQVLGLSPGATQEEIKQAYRRCVKQSGPSPDGQVQADEIER